MSISIAVVSALPVGGAEMVLPMQSATPQNIGLFQRISAATPSVPPPLQTGALEQLAKSGNSILASALGPLARVDGAADALSREIDQIAQLGGDATPADTIRLNVAAHNLMLGSTLASSCATSTRDGLTTLLKGSG